MSDLEYVVKDALMMCDQGAAPNYFIPTYNTTTKIEGVIAATNMDGKPIENIPFFYLCKVSNAICVPGTAPMTWTDTCPVKANGIETLLQRCTCPCTVGGTIEFLTSGQVPLPDDAKDEVDEMQKEAQGHLNDAGYGDTVGESGFWEGFIPVWGSGRDAVNSFQQGEWGWGIAHSALVVVDVFTLGIGSLVKGGVKGAVKGGVKALTKGAFKNLGKGAFKKLSKEALKESLEKVAKAKLLKPATYCFAAGTLIHTKSGLKKIEDIQIGDIVKSYEPDKNEIVYRKVTSVSENEVNIILAITTDKEIIRCTPNHPFYMGEDGYKDAEQLETGDKLFTQRNDIVHIKSTEFIEKNTKVYTFEVENSHCYFVGEIGILVHNACKGATNALESLFKSLKHASDYGIDSYKNLKKLTPGTGLEVHHLIEKRFAGIFKPPKKANEMLSVVLTKEEHQVFTNAWRKKFPYGKPNPTAKEVENFAKEVYKDYPEILNALGL